jgi:PST family polysaccharide transporter
VPWKPGIPQRRTGVKALLGFGGNIVWFNMVNYFSRHLDNFLIGRYWGAGPLGLYEKAYNLLLFPISQINAPLSSVVVPALSRIHTDPAKFKRYFLVVFQLIASVVTPVILIIAIFADQIVELWLGMRWLECAVLFRYLSVAALLGGLSNPIGWLLISAGLTPRYRNLGMMNAVLIVTGFLSGLKFGAEGVALGYSAAMCPATVITWILGLRGTTIKFNDVLKIFLWPAIAAAVASAAALVVSQFVESLLTEILAAGTGLLAFCLVYAFMLLVVFQKWPFYLDVIKAWRSPDVAVI